MSQRTDRVRAEEGFTLIELMVVVLIIGILVAIALPTFLGARTRAQDSGAKALLRTAVAAAGSYYTINGSFNGFDPTAARGEETGVDWAAGAPATTGVVTINLAQNDLLIMSSQSVSGKAFCLLVDYSGSPPMIRDDVDADGAVYGAGPGDPARLCTTMAW